jgi:hypothetical protein
VFSSIQHFTEIWESETAATLSCLNNITDESLSRDLVQDYRTIFRLANHIIDCVSGIPYEAGLPFFTRYNTGGQLTVLMRLVRLKVPGIYGPSKEEGEAMPFLPKPD